MGVLTGKTTAITYMEIRILASTVVIPHSDAPGKNVLTKGIQHAKTSRVSTEISLFFLYPSELTSANLLCDS